MQEILCYHDLYTGNVPDLKAEIEKLNMHKSISIISELINARMYIIEGETCGLTYSFPFDTALKKLLLGVSANSPKEFFSNPLLHKNKHIISLQMLLILLKNVIAYGNYETLSETEYTITSEDYTQIIQLQLIVAEQFDNSFEDDNVDMNHFIYANYHLNYDRNVANEFTRSYYMLEKVSKEKNNFNADVQREYRDYYNVFTEKYCYTPTQYLSLLFWELNTYFPPKNRLTFQQGWRNVESIYGHTAMKDVGESVIKDLSKTPQFYKEWAIATIKEMWDFSLFNAFPFISTNKNEYISISEYTLKNTFFEKLFWKIRECYPKKDKEAMAFYGRLFEKYIQGLTENALNSTTLMEYIPEFEYGKTKKKSSDAYIRNNENLLAIEAKGYSILQDSVTKNEDIQKNNKKLFVDPIIQADKCFDDIEQTENVFNGISTVYVISVTMDSINAVPSYLDSIYEEIAREKKSHKVKYVYNFNIEEYEMLMFLAQEGIDIFEILTNYFQCDRITPFSAYVHEHIKGDIKMTRFMSSIYKEANTEMLSMYKLQE